MDKFHVKPSDFMFYSRKSKEPNFFFLRYAKVGSKFLETRLYKITTLLATPLQTFANTFKIKAEHWKKI